MRSALKKIASPTYRPLELGLIAEAHGRLRQFNVGLGLLAEALEIVEKTNERFFEAELHRLRGELLLRAGRRVMYAWDEHGLQNILGFRPPTHSSGNLVRIGSLTCAQDCPRQDGSPSTRS
jgi:hypothetical protein